MAYSALEVLLTTERYRQRTAAHRGGFRTPSLGYHAVEANALPLLVTNARGSFVPTRRNVEGVAPFGFSFCPVGEEDGLICQLHRAVAEISTREAWSNRCKSVAEAVERFAAAGQKPVRLVVAEKDLWTILGEGQDPPMVRRMMGVRGFVAVVDGMQVSIANLPTGSALVALDPTSVGVFTRVGDYVGVLLQRVDRSLMVVQSDVA